MSIQFKNITMRNFLSIGAVTQAINFDNQDLTLILGENLDLGGDGARNAVGKTTLMQALSYVLFDSPINKIRKNNLINRTNGKNMLVTLEYTSNGTEYKIERGRSPNIMRFYVNGVQQIDEEKEKNTAQGENRETQREIEKTLGMTHDMFKHIVALNTYTEPFLSLGAGPQRSIIEQLLGITLLSEKAEVLKLKIKSNKEELDQEEFKIKTIQEANKRVEEQIDNLKRRQRLWKAKHTEDLNKLTEYYNDLIKIDIDNELLLHKKLAIYVENKKQKELYDSLIARQVAWKQKQAKDLEELNLYYDTLSHINIVDELRGHKEIAEHKTKKIERDSLIIKKTSLENNIIKDSKNIEKLTNEIASLESNVCYACGQDFHDDTHADVLKNKQSLLLAAQNDFDQTKIDLEKIKNEIENLVLNECPNVYYSTEAEAIRHDAELMRIKNAITEKAQETDPYLDQLTNYDSSIEIGQRPVPYYETEAEAIEHKSVVANLITQIEKNKTEIDPYVDQIHDMETSAIQEVNFDRINQLSSLGDHYKFLLDILTSKDSFVRKKIIDQNLSYLNSRLTHYLEKIGLPHTVVFQNDLNVEITELGRDLDFHNLSRGEMNRLILSLSFAFRDVWENLYCPINTLFIDELLDNGTDSIGMENSLSILKDMARNRNKSVWLISHKEELINRVNNVLKVIKENGFTSYSTDLEEI